MDFLFIGLCWQVGESVLGNGAGGHGTAWAAPVTLPWNVHLGACAEGLAGHTAARSSPCQILQQELSLDTPAVGDNVGFAFKPILLHLEEL